MKKKTEAWIFPLILVASLCSACSSSSDDRFSVVKTDQGSYIVDKKIGQSYKYPPEKPVHP